MAELTLYMRPACHLCEEALEILRQLEQPCAQVDIDSDPQLQADYGVLIPVLKMSNGRSLNWPFGPADVKEFVSTQNP